MTNIKHKLLTTYSLLFFAGIMLAFAPHAFAIKDSGTTGGAAGTTSSSSTPTSSPHCGGGVNADGTKNDSVNTAINIGCTGQGNPISDMIFAIIRFLSAGVGLVIVGSIVVAGIQYSASGGDPQAAAKAKSRISSTLMALLIFIFGYAFLNYIIPGGFFHG